MSSHVRSRALQVVIAAVVAVELAAGVAAVARRGDPAPTPAPTPAPSPTPQVPEQAVGAAQDLQARAAQLLPADRACLVVRDGDTAVASISPALPLASASTQKVIVASVALTTLGSDFRFVTRAVASTPVRDGAVPELWIVGGGDPTLSTSAYAAYLAQQPRWNDMPPTPLESLADRIVAAGVRRIEGGVHGDATRYEQVRYLPGWRQRYAEQGDVGPLSALTINGGWTAWTPRFTPAADPAAYAASELARLLTERGVTIGSGADSSPAPHDAVRIAEISSAPLGEIVTGMLRASDNVTAEAIVRELGSRAAGEGSTGAGLAALVAQLRNLDVDLAGVELHDGSGLDPADRTTCEALVDALDAGPGLREHLAVAGRSGTLARRLVGTPLQGRLFAKTGWIAGSVAMVGELDLGRPVRFAIVQNGVSLTPGRTREEQVLDAIAAYSAAAAPTPSPSPAAGRVSPSPTG